MLKEMTKMKELMLGNKAFARGLYEAGCSFASSYPGTPSTEITEEAAKFDDIYCEWAPNEKVAMEAAFGASLAGKRSFCGMKHVGLNVAADPLYTMSYTGVNGGVVICVADDAGMHSSQNEQDSRRHAIGAKVPMLEPSDSKEALEYVKKAYWISEEFDTPVIVKMCTRVSHSQSLVDTAERIDLPKRQYKKNIPKYVMMPGNAIKRHPFVEERMEKLKKWSEGSDINRIEWASKDPSDNIGIVTSSTSYQYVKEVFGESVSVLKLGMVNPLPEKLFREFSQKTKKLYVVEELDPVIEEHIKVLGIEVSGKDILPMEGEFSQNLIRKVFSRQIPKSLSIKDPIPVRPPVMCSGCPHRGLFYTLSKNKCTVMGDIGCYTLAAVAPLSAMDMTLCMGASISSIHGFNKALEKEETDHKKTVAVLGDSTFMHSGMTGLANIAYNQSDSVVIILDNSITGMTGHQQNPTTGYNIKGDPAGKIDLESLCRSMGFERVCVADPYDLSECDRVIKQELSSKGPSVIISRRPCALLKYVKHNPPLVVNPDKCIGCKSCMKIGCPSISMKDGKAVVDKTQCVGCNVCLQLCPKDAFESIAKEGR